MVITWVLKEPTAFTEVASDVFQKIVTMIKCQVDQEKIVKMSKNDRAEEEMYFEMDFSEGKDELFCSKDNDEASIITAEYEDHVDNFIYSSKPDENPRKRSNSIPIHQYNRSCGSPSVRRPSSVISYSASCTSASPSSSFLSRKLRQSFSKLLSRRSFSRSRSPDQCFPCDNTECFHCENRRSSSCSIVSPTTEEVVSESIRNGMPLIPFAYPTFFMASKKQEDVKIGLRKNSLQRMRRSFSEGRALYNSNDLKEEKIEDKSLESIVQLAKEELKLADKMSFNKRLSRKESQSSYVEMNPDSSEETDKEEPLGEMNDKKRTLNRKGQVHRKHNLVHLEYYNSSAIPNSNMRKGNRFKEDYVLLDFEKNEDYVKMGGMQTKIEKFFDMTNKKSHM